MTVINITSIVDFYYDYDIIYFTGVYREFTKTEGERIWISREKDGSMSCLTRSL